MHRANLETAEHVSRLIKRGVTTIHGPPHFGCGAPALMPDAVHEKINGFLGCHFAEMKLQRKNDSRAAMRPPEKHSDAVFRRARKIHVPQQHLPIKRPTL